MVDPPETTITRSSVGRPIGARWAVVTIAMAAVGLRVWGLVDTSLWYDEVVTMRVARTSGFTALLDRLIEIDGARAPLHPLLLHAWLRVFGPSDLAGRAFSVVCGLGVVVLSYVLGRMAFDETTGRWAAWLAAVCPPLVYYSQEARMYAWLGFVTCLSWVLFLSFRSSASPRKCMLYGLSLSALVYSHPLGLCAVAAHGFAFLLSRRALMLSVRRWLILQGALLLSIMPWLNRYLDHGADYPLPRYPIKYLLAVPIEYVGGNGFVLALCVAIIAMGILGHERTTRWCLPTVSRPFENITFTTWLIIPPLLMYVYSSLSEPIFGPPRYHLFIAPAYLVLLAHGLSRLPSALRWSLAGAALWLSLSLLHNYHPVPKADWRTLAIWLRAEDTTSGAGNPLAEPATIVIHPTDDRFTREEVEAARYYLSPPWRVVLFDRKRDANDEEVPRRIYDVYCSAVPSRDDVERHNPTERRFQGMRVIKRNSARPPNKSRGDRTQ